MSSPSLASPHPDAPLRDDAVVTMLRVFYVSEVYGAAAVDRILETYEGLSQEQRVKFATLGRLLNFTVGQLREHLESVWGQKVSAPDRTADMAAVLADQPAGTWQDRMFRLEGISVRAVESYRTLRSIYNARAPELCALLMAKAIAVRDFARRELDGDGEGSLAGILRLLPSADA